MAETAYDLDLFTTAPKRNKSEIKVMKTPKKRRKHGNKAHPLKSVMCCIAVIAVFFAVMYNRAVYTELSSEITKANTHLSELKSEETRLSLGIESMVSMRRVEEIAQTQLGLVKAENYQTEYVSLSTEDKVVVTQQEPGVFEKILRVVVGCFTGNYE